MRWHVDDDPMQEHRRHFPYCPFVTDMEQVSEVIHPKITQGVSSNTLTKVTGALLETDVTTLQQKVESLTDQLQCKICVSNPIDTVLLTCRHFVACKTCAAKINDCPVCRSRIVATMDVYTA